MTAAAPSIVTNRSVIARDEEYAAHNYHPLPIAAAVASGSWVTDVEGNRYLDMLSAYSALNFGHGHPDLVAAAQQQLDTLTRIGGVVLIVFGMQMSGLINIPYLDRTYQVR